MDSDYYLSGLYEQTAFWDSAVSPFVALIIAFVLLIISACVSAAEVAYFSLSPEDMNEVQSERKSSDSLIKRLLARSSHLLTAIFITGNLLQVTIVVLCAFAFYSLFDFSFSPVLGLFVLLLGVTLLVLLSEIPKRYARIYPLPFARTLAPMAMTINFLCMPFSKLVVASASLLERKLTKSTVNASGEAGASSEGNGSRNSDDKEMIEEVMKFYDKTADEIMTSRLDVEDIDIKTGFRTVVDFVLNSGFSRIPIYEDSEDNMKGILYLRDLLPHFCKGDDFEWQKLIRPAYFVPETKKIDDLLEELRANKIHMAIVVDEFGGTSGIVTMEDILEEIVGEIFDEYDEDEKQCIRLADGSFILKAKILLTNFFRMTDIEPEEFGDLTEEVETLGGLLLEIKGGYPQRKEIIAYKHYRFQILELDNRRILKVKFYTVNQEVKSKAD